ncbi:hypothetical protein D3C76_1453190 [compost metagenome]
MGSLPASWGSKLARVCGVTTTLSTPSRLNRFWLDGIQLSSMPLSCLTLMICSARVWSKLFPVYQQAPSPPTTNAAPTASATLFFILMSSPKAHWRTLRGRGAMRQAPCRVEAYYLVS